jgi:hypothetical protein
LVGVVVLGDGVLGFAGEGQHLAPGGEADDDVGVLAVRGYALGQNGAKDVLREGGVLPAAPVQEQDMVKGTGHPLGYQLAFGPEQRLVDGPVEVLGQQRRASIVQPLGEMS